MFITRIFFTKRYFIACMSRGTRLHLTAPSDATYILDTCQFPVSVFILANRRDVLLQIVVFFRCWQTMLLAFKAHAITLKYINTNTTEERSMLSLRHGVTETQSNVEKRKTNRPSTELLFMELHSGKQIEVGRI
jgi:hypothetical protein